MFLTLLLVSARGFAIGASNKHDIRVLVDLSRDDSSTEILEIKKNLLRSIIRLLPKDCNLQVWGMAKETISIIPSGTVDSKWQAKALANLDKLAFSGDTPPLDESIYSISMGWVEPDFDKNRHLFIISDGDLRASKDYWVNKEIGENIDNGVIPKFQRANVKVHSILIKPKSSDSILKKISLGTDGLSHEINDATEIANVVINIFDKTINKHVLPVKNNFFKIDANIDEVTVLIHGENNPDNPLRIRSPSLRIYDPENLADSIKWYQDGKINLVTITNPLRGDWLILGDDTDNSRVLPISNLRLQTTSFPLNLFAGEVIEITANLAEGRNVLRDKELLDLVEFYAQIGIDDDIKKYNLLDNGKINDFRAGDGIYYGKVGPLPYVKEQVAASMRVYASGKTFHRLRRAIVRVLPSPVNLSTSVTLTRSGRPTVKVNISPDIGTIRPDDLSIKAIWENSNGIEKEVEVTKKNPLLWQLVLQPPLKTSSLSVKFFITGKTLSNRDFSVETQPNLIVIPKVRIVEPKKKKTRKSTKRKKRRQAKSQTSTKPNTANSNVPNTSSTNKHMNKKAEDAVAAIQSATVKNNKKANTANADPAQAVTNKNSQANNKTKKNTKVKTKAKSKAKTKSEPEDEVNMILLIAGLLGVNLILFGVGFICYKKFATKLTVSVEADKEK